MKKFRLVVIGLLVSMLASAAMAVQTVTLTSSNFSFGFGASGTFDPNGIWTTNETASVNTPTTIGNFSFTPSLTGNGGSGTGPAFVNRVLSSGGSQSEQPNATTSTVTAAWLGGLPSDTVSEVPVNFRLQLNITAISIYGIVFNASSGELGFTETTPGHAASSPLTTLPAAAFPTDWNNHTKWTQAVWDPADYQVLGTNFSRSFSVVLDSIGPSGNGGGGDGFEVFGNVQLLYDIPEPSAAMLALAGIGIVVIRRRAMR
jgi:hypothetical protein